MALVRTDQPPAYDEDAALNEALAMSMNDQGPPPLEPALPEYGPFQDPKKYENRVSAGVPNVKKKHLMYGSIWTRVQTTPYVRHSRRASMMGRIAWRRMCMRRGYP